MAKQARLIEGKARVQGTTYVKAPGAGDFWVELTEWPMDGDTKHPTIKGMFIRHATASMAGNTGGAAALVSMDALLASIGGTVILPPVNTVLPSITGTAQVAAVLIAQDGNFTGSGITYTYGWLVDGVETGEFGAGYIVKASDLGKRISRRVTATIAGAASVTVQSAQTAAVIAAASLGPASASFAATANSGSLISTISGLSPGETVTGIAPNDGRIAISNGGALVVGLSASSAGTNSYTVTTSAGRTLTIALTVTTASAANSSRLMYGSTRSGIGGPKTAPAAGQECRVSRTHFRTPDYPVQKLTPVLINFGMDRTGPTLPEVDTGNAITIYRITLVVGSAYYTLPWSGTIADGATVVPPLYTLPVAIPPRTDCFWIIGDSCAAGQNSAGGLTRQSANGEQVARAGAFVDGWFDGTVAIPNGSNIAAPGGGGLYAPATTLTDGWDGRCVVDIEGDSMAEPANDNANFAGASGVQGFIARGLDSNASGTLRLPHANFAIAGSRPSGMSSRDAGKFQRRGLMHDAMRAANAALGIMGSDGKGALPFTRIASEHINNDASSGAGTQVSTLQAVMDAYWAFLAAQFPDAGIVQFSAMTANYSDTSTNANTGQWTTLESQAPRTIDTTPGTGARWVVSDGYLNNKPAVLADVIDCSAYFMDVATRKWKVRPFSSAGAVLTADYTGGLTISMTVAPQVGEALVVGAGTASAAKPQMVSAVSGSGPYTVTLFAGLVQVGTGQGSVAAVVATQTAGTVVKASGPTDGLHAASLPHIEAADCIIQGQLAGKFPNVVSGPSTNILAEAVGTLTRSGTQVYRLAAGASISGTNASHFSVDANGVLTVSSAGQTAALNAGPYTLTITGDSSVTTLRIPTEAGTIDVFDTLDASSLTAAVNYAYSTAPSGTDWVVRPRVGSVSAATSVNGILFQGKAFGGTFTDVNKGIVDETKIVRAAKASVQGGSLTIQPRTAFSAKLLGFASTTAGACLVLWASNNFAVLDMVIENTAGADGSDISVPDRSDDIYPAQAATTCVTVRMDGAPSWTGNHIVRNCRVGSPDSAPYTRYPVGINVRSGGNVAIEDCSIKNTLISVYGATFLYLTLRRNLVRGFLLDGIDLFNDTYAATNPAYPGNEPFLATSDNVIAAPNIGPQFAGAHCDGLQGLAAANIRSVRVSCHFDVHAMDADENVKATQGILLKDLPPGVYVRGRITNCFIHPSTLNGMIFAGMDPDDRLVIDKITIMRSTVADPGSQTAGPARITVEKSNNDATRHGPIISRSIFGAFVDTTGATKIYTADPTPGAIGYRTLTGGGLVGFDRNFYLSQLTPNTGVKNSAQEVFTGLSNAAFVANRGVQYAYDYTDYNSIRASASTLFAVNSAGPAAGTGASLADIFGTGAAANTNRITLESGTGSLLSESGGGFILQEVA